MKAAPTSKRSRDWSRVRLLFVAVFFFLCLGALWGRAYWVQVCMGPKYADMARRQHMAAEIDRGERGEILDRNGRLLAKSVQSTSIYARPQEVDNAQLAASRLSEILGISKAVIHKQLTAKAGFVWIARQIGDKASAQATAMLKETKLKGVCLTSDFSRFYPNSQMAGQLLGFVSVDEKGLEGLERSYDSMLAGRQARYVVQRDASGRKMYLDDQGQEVSVDGQGVQLTLDAHIQFVAEDALARTVNKFGAKSGICLVVKVEDGEILAWANYPFFNPNSYKQYKPAGWTNRIAMDVHEPGSTMKPFVVAAALQEGLIKKDTEFNCEMGKWKVAGALIRDTHSYGRLPVHKIVRYSSNIGAGKIGLLLGSAKYHDYLEKLGFGERSGLPLPGESRGIMRPVNQWSDQDLISAAFGQSVGATAVQMARAYLCLATGGIMRPLKLVLDPPQECEPERRVFSQDVASQVLTMLQEVVEEDGTGTIARIPGLNVGGKTGTAQKAKAGGGYGDEYLSSFIALIPAEKPEYLVLVMIDEPSRAHYGGVVAAPAVREVTLKSLAYLGKLPDAAQTEPPVVDNVAPQPPMPPKIQRLKAEDARPAPMPGEYRGVAVAPGKAGQAAVKAGPAGKPGLAAKAAPDGKSTPDGKPVQAVQAVSPAKAGPAAKPAPPGKDGKTGLDAGPSRPETAVQAGPAKAGAAAAPAKGAAPAPKPGEAKAKTQAANAAPDVRGQSLRRAMEILSARGISPLVQGRGGAVARQEPAPGQPVTVEGGGFTIWLERS